MYELRINPLAKQDLHDIKEYIANELNNPISAIKVVSEIVESFEKLKEYPMIGCELSAKIDISTDYKYLLSGNYIIFYKSGNSYASIYRILYSRRDYTKILFDDERFNKR